MTEKARLFAPQKYGEDIGMRPGSMIHGWTINFVFNMGGMGDFVNYSAATQWVMNNCPWVHGRVVAPRYLTPLMQDIHPKWKCVPSETFQDVVEKGDAIIGPDIHINGINTSRQFVTVVGAHPVDVGFAYYAGTIPALGDLPVLDYPKDRLIKAVREIGPYVVFPVGNVQASRKVLGQHLNPIIDYVKRVYGFTPVFLGKSDLLGNGKQSTTFDQDVNYHLGLDLRDRTTVKEAAAIMQHAEFTLGLDTGLLHLAALMKNSKIIFGYNITSVAHRAPRRKHGLTVNLTLTEAELKCIGCQSKLKHISGHTFDQCLYKDLKCVDLLFEPKKWFEAIDEIMA